MGANAVAGSSPPRPRGRVLGLTFLAIVAVSLLIRLYPAVSAVNLTPDAVEYLDEARHTARGEFGVIAIKRHYFDDFPVVYSGIDDRAPLFPLVAAAAFALGGSVVTVQLINVLFASLASGFWYLAFQALFSWRVATGAALAATFSIWFWGASVFPVTEPLSMLLVGLLAWIVAAGAWSRPRGAAALGALAALAYLTRHANMVLFPVLLGLLVAGPLALGGPRPWRRILLGVALAAAAATLFLAPVAVQSTIEFGSPFFDSSGAPLRWGWEAFDRYATEPADSVLAFARSVGVLRFAKLVAQSLYRTTASLLIGPGGLGLVALGLPLLLFGARGMFRRAGAAFLLALAGVNFALHVAAYAFHEPRYLLLSTVPLYPLCLAAVESWPGADRLLRGERGGARRRAGVLLVWLLAGSAVAQGIVAYTVMTRQFPIREIAGQTVRVYPPDRVRYAPAEYESLFRWIEAETTGAETVATRMIWLVRWFTDRPVALLPGDLDARSLERFVDEYDVRALVLDEVSMGRQRFQRYLGLLHELALSRGGRVRLVGPFVVYQVPPRAALARLAGATRAPGPG